jgi:hypothetical protein
MRIFNQQLALILSVSREFRARMSELHRLRARVKQAPSNYTRNKVRRTASATSAKQKSSRLPVRTGSRLTG